MTPTLPFHPIDAAFAALRKKGLAAAAKKASRTAAEGLVAVAVDGGRGALTELNAETDFAARHPGFLSLVTAAARDALSVPSPAPSGGQIDASGVSIDGSSVADAAAALAGAVRENVLLRRAARLDAPAGGVLGAYVHTASPDEPSAGRIAALVALAPATTTPLPPDTAATLGRALAMHVAATRPLALDVASLPAAAVAAEADVAHARAAASGKPPAIIDRIVAGRLAKWHEDVVLLSQKLVTDDSVTVGAAVKKASARVSGFVRLQVGEGVEKAGGDFAAEVAAAVKEAS